MPSLSQLILNFLELRLHAITPRLPAEQELALLRLTADESETQEVEGFRLAKSAFCALLRRITTEHDQPGLFRMKRQRELLQPFTHRVPETAGIAFMLKAENDVVGIPHENHIARGFSPSPAFSPKIKSIVKVDVGQ